jgi:hypothetical protein
MIKPNEILVFDMDIVEVENEEAAVARQQEEQKKKLEEMIKKGADSSKVKK